MKFIALIAGKSATAFSAGALKRKAGLAEIKSDELPLLKFLRTYKVSNGETIFWMLLLLTWV
jgi:hypothetical protein